MSYIPNTSDLTSPSASPLRLTALVVLVACAAHLGALTGGFATVDDHALVVENPAIKSVGLRPIFRLFTGTVSGTYLPVRALSYAVDYRLWGLSPFGYHLANLVLHGLAAVVLLWGVAHVTGTARLGFMVALLFAAHPIHVEGVAWVSGRKEMLCTVFSLCACLCYLRARCEWANGQMGEQANRPTGESANRRSPAHPSVRPFAHSPIRIFSYLAALAFTFLACASKGVAVVLAALFLLLDLCRIRFWPNAKHPIPSTEWPLSRRIAFHLPFWLLAGAFVVVHALAGRSSGALVEPRGGSMAANALLSMGHLPTYVRLMLFPFHLRPRYAPADSATLTTVHVVLTVMVAAAVAALGAWSFARRERRWAGFCIGWFLVNWLPVSSLVFPIGTTVAERYLQMPILGWYFLAAGSLVVLAQRGRGRGCRTGCMGVFAIAVASYAALTVHRGLDWESGRSLWAKALPLAPSLADNHVGLGNAYLQAGESSRAARAFQAALSRDPNSSIAVHNLGLAYHRQGRLDAALALYQRANQLSREGEKDHSNIGIIYYEQGRYADALAEYQKAIRARPDFAQAHHNMGNAYVRVNELEAAVAAYRRAIDLDPGFGDAYLALGKVHFSQGNLAEAVRAFLAATQLGPHFAEAHACLGVLLHEISQARAARDQLQMSLALDPTVWQAHYLAGMILEEEGKLDGAADAYARSFSLNPQAEAVRERLQEIRERLRQAGPKAPTNSARPPTERP